MVTKVLTWSTIGSALIFVILSLLLVFQWRELGEADPDPRVLEDLLDKARSVADLAPAADGIEKADAELRGIQDPEEHLKLRHRLLDQLANLVVKADIHVGELAARSRLFEASPTDGARQQEAETARENLEQGRELRDEIAATVRKIRATPLRDALLYVGLSLAVLAVVMATAILVLSAFSSDA